MKVSVKTLTLLFFICNCVSELDERNFSYPAAFGGNRAKFKVPVPPGYDWEVSQSWKSHCKSCNKKAYDWNYCKSYMSHTWSCCKYAWDFNLPGSKDRGKSVLASADGKVEDVSYSSGWGNYVVINHGNNLCTRYAHMLDYSTDHLSKGQSVCQGLEIGKIGDTGESDGEHLHFHFEKCDEPGISIQRSFSDGNGVPECTRGDDVYDKNGRYSFLELSNVLKKSCSSDDSSYSDAVLPEKGWLHVGCGSIPLCPLVPNCNRTTNYYFSDQLEMKKDVLDASLYLYSECALDGKIDGGVHPDEKISRAEALKIPLFLFGLMDGCGSFEPFLDVNEADWYFSVVACAVRHGIINTISEFFLPNDSVTFVEAAKFIVEAGIKAGLINTVNFTENHFKYIDENHWGLMYLETLYSYGGLGPSYTYYNEDYKVKRGEFISMLASLSPCFCSNVICGGNCACDQSVYACVDSNNDTFGSGGSSNSRTGGYEKSFDLKIDCFVNYEKTECVNGKLKFYIKCYMKNDGVEVVKVNNLVMKLNENEDKYLCKVTLENLRSGVSTQNIYPGEYKYLTGHFEVTCDSIPSDNELQVSFDLLERLAGIETFYNDIATDSIEVENREICLNLDGWNCNPQSGYQVQIYSPGGSFSYLKSGSVNYLSSSISLSSNYYLTLDCDDLPTAILIKGGGSGLSFFPRAEDFPAFPVWMPYFGELVLSPLYEPNTLGYGINSSDPYINVLVRVPE